MSFINPNSLATTRFLSRLSHLPHSFDVSFSKFHNLQRTKPRFSLLSSSRNQPSSSMVVDMATNDIAPVRTSVPPASYDTQASQVRTSSSKPTKVMASSKPITNQHPHFPLSSSGSEEGETYPRDIKNSVLKSLARAGHHETFENLRKKFFREAEEELEIAGILGADQPYHKEGKRVIHELLLKGSIPEDDYFGIAGKDIGITMLDGNVFVLDHDCRLLSFQSTVMREYCKQQSARWI